MRNYIKVFTTFWNTGNVLSQSYQCFVCSEWNAVDIHHISSRGMGGSKNNAKDFPENLAALCRSCHNKTSNKDFNTLVRIQTLNKVKDQLLNDIDQDFLDSLDIPVTLKMEDL
jgi:hypothetical protein